jgi:hypothetical protein
MSLFLPDSLVYPFHFSIDIGPFLNQPFRSPVNKARIIIRDGYKSRRCSSYCFLFPPDVLALSRQNEWSDNTATVASVHFNELVL